MNASDVISHFGGATFHAVSSPTFLVGVTSHIDKTLIRVYQTYNMNDAKLESFGKILLSKVNWDDMKKKLSDYCKHSYQKLDLNRTEFFSNSKVEDEPEKNNNGEYKRTLIYIKSSINTRHFSRELYLPLPEPIIDIIWPYEFQDY